MLTLIDDQTVGMECADYDGNMVAALHQPALVGEDHPVGLAILRCRALAQLSYVFKGRDYEADPGLWVDERGLVPLVVKNLGLFRIQHPVAEANDLARLAPLDDEESTPQTSL